MNSISIIYSRLNAQYLYFVHLDIINNLNIAYKNLIMKTINALGLKS